MKKTIITFALTSAMIMTPTLTLAGGNHHHEQQKPLAYTGAIETTSVAELLNDTSMFTEKNVIVDGYIVRQINKDTFIFSDSETDIQVELDDVYLEQALNNETRIRIFGEYEGGNTPEIEVDHIQIL
ncbi:NirD/YgiW/YdeI family stress tolerance protein [Vibrio sp. ZSDZ34]|uniref:NirD/YgiW/YdeI family stress tolerance protein n=1 Tax=Vibrio gelatinilyticus TaxID=2893468 RepID=A0A9X2AWE1_9VIBR|nr:NirD/YgiW/YdeI family stress tolerance protein [Vibrio gelatinilyticus]MCJ2377171.1 NirD/YgiW/YdeI family stress tolerance protein [Vibrio gelatinilyticus]